jgi:tetratricopeptide (TPR) repeat protein
MKADLLILQICEFLDDGDGMYRLHQPSLYLSRLPGVVVVDCHFYHRFLPALLDKADLLVLPFIHNWDIFPLIEKRRAAGQVTVFEANDYFYDVQPWNAVGTQWQDRAIQDEYRYFMGAADAVQTSTNELAGRWRPWSRDVAVFSNYLTEIPPLNPPPARPLTVGWGGSPGHFADWYHLAPTLQKWLDAHPAVHLAVMTNEFAKPFLQLPPERYHFTPFGSLTDYLKFLRSLDIGLAPLLPTEYNRCRSDVKYLEYAAHGVAGIYADLEPYRETIVHGQTGLLYKTEQEFLQHLDALASDPLLRQRIREQAYAYVSRNRRLPEHIGERLAYYRRLLPGPARGCEISPEVVAASIRDGNYLQLRPQEPEKTFLATLKAGSSREGVQTLARLLEQYPHYTAVLQEQGRFLNDLRDCRSALFYLTRAQSLNPQSAFTLCEIGRAYFGLNDIAKAREHIEAALAINPLYIPGWQYLLRLLGLTKSPDGPRWAERAHQTHPRNFILALAGARLYSGLEAVKVLQRLVDLYAPSFTAQELPAATAEFGQTILDVAGPWLGTPQGLELLRRTCDVFPHSARLADLLGYALHVAGHHEESARQYVRALEIRRLSAIYRVEYPKEDGRYHFWQFAENIQTSLAKAKPESK